MQLNALTDQILVTHHCGGVYNSNFLIPLLIWFPSPNSITKKTTYLKIYNAVYNKPHKDAFCIDGAAGKYFLTFGMVVRAKKFW